MQNYECFGVYVLFTYEGKVLLNDRSLFFSLAKRTENPQQCARRLYKETFGKTRCTIRSLSFIERAPVTNFTDLQREGWPKAIKTIPLYGFEIPVKSKGEYENWLEIHNAASFVPQMQQKMLEALSMKEN